MSNHHVAIVIKVFCWFSCWTWSRAFQYSLYKTSFWSTVPLKQWHYNRTFYSPPQSPLKKKGNHLCCVFNGQLEDLSGSKVPKLWSVSGDRDVSLCNEQDTRRTPPFKVKLSNIYSLRALVNPGDKHLKVRHRGSSSTNLYPPVGTLLPLSFCSLRKQSSGPHYILE